MALPFLHKHLQNLHQAHDPARRSGPLKPMRIKRHFSIRVLQTCKLLEVFLRELNLNLRQTPSLAYTPRARRHRSHLCHEYPICLPLLFVVIIDVCRKWRSESSGDERFGPLRYFVPNMRSPASPRPGTIYPFSLRWLSNAAVTIGTSG